MKESDKMGVICGEQAEIESEDGAIWVKFICQKEPGHPGSHGGTIILKGGKSAVLSWW